MLIEVKETHPPTGSRRSGTVVTVDGQRLDCWPNMLQTIQIGNRYEVETSTNDRGYTSIKKATPVNGAAHCANGNGSAPPEWASTPIATEAGFVREVLAALILKGEVIYSKRSLYDATLLLRDLYGATFGGGANGGADA